MGLCCVPLCSTLSGQGVKLYSMPKDIHKRKQYANCIKRPNWIPSDKDLICEKHFATDQYEIKFDRYIKVPKHKRILKADAKPTIFPHLNLSEDTRTNYNNSVKIGKNVESILKDHEYTFGKPQNITPIEDVMVLGKDHLDGEAEIEIQSSDPHADQLAIENEKLKQLLEEHIQRIETLEKEKKILKEEKENGFLPTELFSRIFGEDQIKFLKKGRVHKWSEETIRKGLKLRFATGTRAYEDLIKAGYPLPSVRTLNQRSEHIKFEPGSFDEVIEMMGEKFHHKPDSEKLFTLSLDEMALKAGSRIEYDIRSDSYVGNSTLPGHSGSSASKALVFQIASIGGPRVKQVIGYHLTPSSVDSKPVAEIIENIIIKCHNVGITIMVVTADAGSTNKGAFSKLGCELTKNSDFTNFFIHPCDSNLKVYVIFDQPHVLKSLASMLRSHKEFKLPEDFVTKHGLPSSRVKIEHVQKLLDFQNKTLFKLSPLLRKGCLDPAHFQKMNVGLAMGLFSRDVANGLRYLVQEEDYPNEMLTTAFFIEFIARWMELVNSRFHSIALSKHNMEVYNLAIQHLEEMIGLFKNIDIGGKWKIVQTSIITTTKSIINLQDLLLNVHGFDFVLTARFSQDSLKNLFSIIRRKNCDPTVREFLYCLRSIMLSQYLREVKSSSYDFDEGQYALDFLDKKKTADLNDGVIEERINDEELEEFIDKYSLTADKELLKVEQRILYYLSGHTIFSVIKKRFKTCPNCLPLSMKEKNNYDNDIAKYQKLRDYNGDALIQCDETLFEEFFLPAETLFRSFVSDKIVNKKGLLESLLKIFFKDRQKKFQCHDLDHVLAKRFFQIRLHLNAREVTRETKEIEHGAENSSRTVKMRDMAKKHGKKQSQKRAPKNSTKNEKKKIIQKKKEKAENSRKNTPAKNVSTIKSKIPSHWSKLDPPNMKVKEMQHELLLRGLSNKGVKKVLTIRLKLLLDREKNLEEKKSSGKSTRNSNK